MRLRQKNDPHTPAGNPCGFDAAAPCDDHGHGTHTMGIMVGDDGNTQQIGMAPGARWIGCRNMEQGWGKPSTYIECFQWFIAPTDLNDENPNTSLAPDVINNSWSCPTSEGCTDPNALLTVVQNVRAAGILTVQSAGNSGPTCHSISEPAAIYDASFTVGSTDLNDTIATYSSRGTVTVDGSARPKPDISAPGSSIHSSYLNGGYTTMSGTSMAGPHVVGLAALLISADPTLAGVVDRLEILIEESSKHIVNNQCGGDTSGIPNNVYGWGRIDAFRAFLATRFAYYFPFVGITPK
jgi:subtilisin family serine protease